MIIKIVIGFIILGTAIFMGMSLMNSKSKSQTENTDVIRYLPVGDSYTIGNGVAASERWPNVLSENLNQNGVKIQIIGNPAVSGYTVSDAVKNELPIVKQMQPDFVTVFIGTNDNFRGSQVADYERELKTFLDELQSIMKNPKNIALITIPDYSISPAAVDFDRDGLSASIQEYNKVIKSEGQKRGLPVADIFPISQTMTGASDYISDGLHPSAQGYKKWEEVIYPVVFEFLKK